MSLGDTVFSCLETPLWFPAAFDLKSIQPCLSCSLRFVSTVPGPGNVSPRSEGLLVNENPLTTLTINGIQYTLLETVLSFPGGHRLLDRQSPCDAELFLYFRSIKNLSDVACFAIPLDVGAGAANKYFETLDIGVVKNRPTVGSVIPTNSQIVSYRGADLRGRNGGDSNPRTYCDPIKSLVTYYVCLTPAKIAAEDYRRLQVRAGGKSVAGPARPTSPPVLDRIRRICSLITGLVVEAAPPTAKKAASRADYDTSAMKCYRIDPERDVKGGRVYVGEGPTTLKKELDGAKAAADADLGGLSDTSIQPGDIEKGVGIALGVFVGIVVCAAIAYYIWNNTFRNYMEAQKLYETITDAKNLTTAAAALPALTGWFSSLWSKSPSVCEAPAPSAPAVSVAGAQPAAPLLTAPTRPVPATEAPPGSVPATEAPPVVQALLNGSVSSSASSASGASSITKNTDPK